MRPSRINVFSEQQWNNLTKRLDLSPRESQIVRLMLDGHKNYSAANVIGISPETVRKHLNRLYRKLGVQDRFELLCLLAHTACRTCHHKQ